MDNTDNKIITQEWGQIIKMSQMRSKNLKRKQEIKKQRVKSKFKRKVNCRPQKK